MAVPQRKSTQKPKVLLLRVSAVNRDYLPGQLHLQRTYWGAVLWSPGFFSSTVRLNEAVIRRYVEHQERMDKGQIQLEFEF